jgi:excisionase family DNA binding protein
VNDKTPPQSLSKTEAAKRLNVSVRTLERLLEAGELEGVRAGPQGGLRPTRASVEHRLKQLGATTRATDIETEPAAADAPAPATTDGETATLSPVEPALVAATSVLSPRGGGIRPVRTTGQLVRTTRRVVAHLLRLGRRQVTRALRHAAKRPARIARGMIAAALIAALIALGATRERPGATTSAARHVTVLVITSYDHGEARHRTRLRCRTAGSRRPVKVYLRREQRARCT